MEKAEGCFYVEYLAAREGLDLAEYFAGIVRTKGNWKKFDKSGLTVVYDKEHPLLTITIDGSKDTFKTGDVLEWLTESDISNMHNVASFTKSLLRIVPSGGKNLSIEFIWTDTDKMIKAIDDAFSKMVGFGLDVFGWG
ncbi:MAG: hypothetical protein AMDU3_IPLC00003G0023 [Thermoplasmatales archaeon I-plasma]|jgi:hypothetical protein|nr:MAG: hypothetical protein AMDU3_IPLC00003G0023 [Thermoplasmatales archaeon I-plasma]